MTAKPPVEKMTTETATPEAPEAPEASEALPLWDLTDLYRSPNAPELVDDLAGAEAAARDFETEYKGCLARLDARGLEAAISAYETIAETLSRVLGYAYLRYAGDVSLAENGRFLQSMQERANDISSHTLFFELELNCLAEDHLAGLLAEPGLAHYRPWIENTRIHKPHQLSDEIERLLHDKSVAGANAWIRLFDETMAALRFRLDGRDLTIAETLDRLSHPDVAVRREAAHAVGDVLAQNVRVFTLITNTLAKDKEVEDRWRKYPTPMSPRHLSNLVEDEVVEALRSAVRGAYPRLSHRYYTLKAKWFGGDRLDYWDRNAPLPDEDHRVIPWAEAQATVLDAYGRFSPVMQDTAATFFARNWIDAQVRPGKESGAFSHPTVPTVHPYILLNYQGKTRDVMTLAHELGHGVHQMLAGPKGYLLADTPLTLAETASVFGEMLTFRSMLDKESEPRRRRAMLAQKVEDMLNTVVRQIAFYEFEIRVHAERRKAELLPEDLGRIWMEVQGESLGPALRFDDQYRHFWAYIPHFIHSPFYVYAYAFGDCLVNALYAVFEKGEPGFAERYLDMLRAGGAKRHRELLAPFGLDASDPDFWALGLGVLEGFIDELEAADQEVD